MILYFEICIVVNVHSSNKIVMTDQASMTETHSLSGCLWRQVCVKMWAQRSLVSRHLASLSLFFFTVTGH